ncbi:MAG TPA: phosphate ABC transporter permease PstA [Verrucomicrobiales bacterium]|nr:phosphate ABC transporter permease PstA [Verrucomicrobiales bacterium]
MSVPTTAVQAESAQVPAAAAPFVVNERVRRKLRRERAARAVFALMVALMLLPLFSILAYLVIKGAPMISWEFLTTNPKSGMIAGGIWSALLGTIWLVVVSLAVSAPIGVLAAVYLNEYARDTWFTRTVNLAVLNLAGVPSIVHALFGMGAFVLFFGMGRCVLAAALTLAVMTMPVVITATREALGAVPMSFREACWNVGATRWQTIWRIVLPNSISGILTGVILEISRKAGETVPIMFTGAVFYRNIAEGDLFAYSLREQVMALSMHLYTVTTQVTGVPEALPFAVATVLIAAIIGINSTAIVFRIWLRNRKKW